MKIRFRVRESEKTVKGRVSEGRSVLWREWKEGLLKMVAAPFKIVFDEDLYVVFDEDLYVLFMYFCFALSMS